MNIDCPPLAPCQQCQTVDSAKVSVGDFCWHLWEDRQTNNNMSMHGKEAVYFAVSSLCWVPGAGAGNPLQLLKVPSFAPDSDSDSDSLFTKFYKRKVSRKR